MTKLDQESFRLYGCSFQELTSQQQYYVRNSAANQYLADKNSFKKHVLSKVDRLVLGIIIILAILCIATLITRYINV